MMALDRRDAQPTNQPTNPCLLPTTAAAPSDAEPKQADGALQRAPLVLLALGPSHVGARALGLPTVKCPFPFINEPTNANGSFEVGSVRSEHAAAAAAAQSIIHELRTRLQNRAAATKQPGNGKGVFRLRC